MIFFITNGKITAWCERYVDDPAKPDRSEITAYTKLKAAVWAAAKIDPLCGLMIAQAQARFGLWIPDLAPKDPAKCLARDVMAGIVEDIFYYWAHPSIGNIGLSGEPRDPHRKAAPWQRELRPAWRKCNALSQAGKASILKLSKSMTFQRFDLAARDQVRIVRNETELARAIVGEVTCAATRRLEKLFALRLCDSDALTSALIAMFRPFMEAGGGFDELAATQAAALEYIPYYFSWLKPLLNTDTGYRFFFLRCLYLALTQGADDAADVKRALRALARPASVNKAALNGIEDAIVTTWLLLPVSIRCVMLLNDIKRLWLKGGPKTRKVTNSSRVMLRLQLPNDATSDLACTIVAADTSFPQLTYGTMEHASSWSRDEAQAGTIGYRAMLCPLWGGPSGHVISALAFWKAAVGDLCDPTAIALGLFAFWRLYYDKRITPAHALVEAVEETWSFQFDAGTTAVKLPRARAAADMSKDAFLAAETCLAGGALDPYGLFSMLEQSYRADAIKAGATTLPQQFAWLLGEINRLGGEFDKAGYVVPQWAWDLNGRTAVAVGSVAPLYGQITAATQLNNDALQSLILAYVGPSDQNDGKDQKGLTFGATRAAADVALHGAVP